MASSNARVLERDIQQDIRAALGLEPDLVLWRNSTGKFETFDERSGRGRTIKTGLVVGACDLIGILAVPFEAEFGPDHLVGRFFALEIKTPVGRLSTEQRQFIELVRRMGGFAAIARSVDEAKQALARARRGECE